jgi:E3 ubiquitin-protein ligase HERC4
MWPSLTLDLAALLQRGQLGLRRSDTNVLAPELAPLQASASVSFSFAHAAVVSGSGALLSAGGNDSGELAREGRPSIMLGVDAIEAHAVLSCALGDGFSLALTREGKLFSWGRNDVAQLGHGDRGEARPRPKLVALKKERAVSVVAGKDSALCLTSTGAVLAWGAGKHGTIGNGSFVSEPSPVPVVALMSRPVVEIAAGAEHCLAATASGLLYTWGANAEGQLGLGDTTPRLRPTLCKALRLPRACHVAAGEKFSAVISAAGGVFTFGFGVNGQLGHGSGSRELSPRLIERFAADGSDWASAVVCGLQHTLAIARPRGPAGPVGCDSTLFAWGLGSSGQLGCGDTEPRLVPTRVPGFRGLSNLAAVFAGGHSSAALLSSAPSSSQTKSIPALNFERLAAMLTLTATASAARSEFDDAGADGALRQRKVQRTGGSDPHEHTRRMHDVQLAIMDGFASPAVLNASFLEPGPPQPVTASHSGLDHLSIRHSYNLLLSHAEGELFASRLNVATLRVAEHMKRSEMLFDEAENLRCFLVVLENPILLQPESCYVALGRIVSAMLSLPRPSLDILFSWLRRLPSEFFARIVRVLSGYVTLAVTRPALGIDCTPAVLLLEHLFHCNEAAGLLPPAFFTNAAVSAAVNLADDLARWRSSPLLFSFCRFPFLLDLHAKARALHHDAATRMAAEQGAALVAYYAALFRGAAAPAPLVNITMTVRRGALMAQDAVAYLSTVLRTAPSALHKPLATQYVGEEAVDRGGVQKEMLSLLCQELLHPRLGLFEEDEEGRALWFAPSPPAAGTEEQRRLAAAHSTLIEVCGVVVGLAIYNGVLVDVQLPAQAYKLASMVKGAGAAPPPKDALSLRDLSVVRPALARSLGLLLQGSQGAGAPLEEAFDGLTFEVTEEPHRGPTAEFLQLARGAGVLPHAAAGTTEPAAPPLAMRSVELRAGGRDEPVTPRDAEEFVRLYVHRSLWERAAESIRAFSRGLHAVVGGVAFELCRPDEVEHLVKGRELPPDLRELEAGAVYVSPFSADHPTVQSFWRVVHALPHRLQRRLLAFATGSDRVPLAGLAAVGLTIQRAGDDPQRLPAAHTCFSTIDLPERYPSDAHLHEKLLQALEQPASFGLV